MSTEKVKVCPKCGWVYPATSKNCTCFICGTQFTEGYCAMCGEHTTKLVNGKYCRSCFYSKYKHTACSQRSRQRMYERYDSIYANWMSKIKNAPSQTLTEAQWLEACKHFNGCAYCGSESIEARSYFIPFKNGGRYCAWNIIPACGHCAASSESKQPDPFRRMINQVKRGTLEEIIKYLEVQLNAAIARATRNPEQHDSETTGDKPNTV